MECGEFMKNKNVTKKEIIEVIYENTQLKIDKIQIQEIVDTFLQQIKESLESGNSIELRGFGTFEPRLRNAKENARNPKTGESVKVNAHYVAAFRAGQELKDKLWNLKIDEK